MSPDLIYLSAHRSNDLTELGLDTVLYSDCDYDLSKQSSRAFQFVKTILLYLIPFLLMFCAHYRILKVLKLASTMVASSSASHHNHHLIECNHYELKLIDKKQFKSRTEAAVAAVVVDEDGQLRENIRKKLPRYRNRGSSKALEAAMALAQAVSRRRSSAAASSFPPTPPPSVTPAPAYGEKGLAQPADSPIRRGVSDRDEPTKHRVPALLDVSDDANSTVLVELSMAATSVTGSYELENQKSNSESLSRPEKMSSSIRQVRFVDKLQANSVSNSASPTTMTASLTNRKSEQQQVRGMRLNDGDDDDKTSSKSKQIRSSSENNIDSAAPHKDRIENKTVAAINSNDEKKSFQVMQQTSFSQQDSGQQQTSFMLTMHNKSKLESRRKAAQMLTAIVILFGICYLPVHLINFLRQFISDIPQTDVTSSISMLAHCICYLNSAINPIIYNHMNSVFRQEFKRSLEFCLNWSLACRRWNIKWNWKWKKREESRSTNLANDQIGAVSPITGNSNGTASNRIEHRHHNDCDVGFSSDH